LNVVDSSGWIEYVLDGPNASEFQPPLVDLEHLVVPVISVFEVYRYVLREKGREAALAVVASMRQGRIVDLDAALAVEAAETAVTHGLPMADGIIYAVAQLHGAVLWTQDADFRDLQGVRFIPARAR
jgi:predicted nucleic acid-binding protein